jgi:hypothetical protein
VGAVFCSVAVVLVGQLPVTSCAEPSGHVCCVGVDAGVVVVVVVDGQLPVASGVEPSGHVVC